MGSRNAAQAIYSEEVDEMNMEERVGKLEVKVDHIQSDLTEVKTDVRELRTEMNTLKVALEKFKGQLWLALAVLFVMQLLTMGGAPAAIARAFKWP
jgi:uncharacterized coiled-coil protein SlyX